MTKQFDIITIFPDVLDSYFSESILGRAQKKKLIKITTHDLRKYSTAKSKVHRSVDDKPYGGGPGMIMLVEPIYKALRAVTGDKKQVTSKRVGKLASRKKRVIMLTPAGKKFTQRDAERLAKYDQLILLSGRYEGFDARVDKLVDEKISIGDYVLAGGELPAAVVVEAVARNVPGVVGHEHALDDETFSHGLDYVEYPQYSRPEVFEIRNPKSEIRKLRVPRVLLSGDHGKIKEWRKKTAKKK